METTFKVRSTCRLCRGANLELVMGYGLMPLAGGFVPASDLRSSMVFPLDLMRCDNCTLIQTAQDIAPELLFSQYSYSSSSSPGLVEHFRRLAGTVSSLSDSKNRLYIDIGCNDGIMIRPMIALGMTQVLGVDPSDVALRASIDQGWPIVNEYLTPEVAERIIRDYGHAHIITASNVIAHNSDPHPMIDGIRKMLDPNGFVVAEVHYQANLIQENQFDTVYHEHTCYYSLRALDKLFGMHGLTIYRAVLIPNHGGSIRVFASPTSLNSKYNRSPVVDDIIALEVGIDWKSFSSRSRVIRDRIWEIINRDRSRNHKICAYGASGRGTILLNWCNLDVIDVSYVVDRSPLRIGRVVPGVRVPIVSVDEFEKDNVYTCLLTAWNYSDSIMNQHPSYRGHWLIPLPEVEYI